MNIIRKHESNRRKQPLTSFGASLRQPLGPGLFNAEFSWYLSRDDRRGDNPLVPNDQFRFLAGYAWEARANFTVGLQYYVERTLDHDRLVAYLRLRLSY